jgi:hypothetical protein
MSNAVLDAPVAEWKSTTLEPTVQSKAVELPVAPAGIYWGDWWGVQIWVGGALILLALHGINALENLLGH